jgi:hypothetical protein
MSQTINEIYQNIITFKWKNYNSNLHEITILNSKKLVNMGLIAKNPVDEFLSFNWKEFKHFFAYIMIHIKKINVVFKT